MDDTTKKPPAQTADTRTQISWLRESMILLREQQSSIIEAQSGMTLGTKEILDVLKGTYQTPGVLQRLSDVERAVKSVNQDLCEHIGEHKSDETSRRAAEAEEARDRKKRTWDRQDSVILAIILMAITPFIEAILRALQIIP